MNILAEQRVRIDTQGDLNWAVDIAQAHGGWIAQEIDGESAVFWYSCKYTPSDIVRDMHGLNCRIGPWNKFVTLWGGLVEHWE